jgi:hypothetical protein
MQTVEHWTSTALDRKWQIRCVRRGDLLSRQRLAQDIVLVNGEKTKVWAQQKNNLCGYVSLAKV